MFLAWLGCQHGLSRATISIRERATAASPAEAVACALGCGQGRGTEAG